MRKQRSIKLEVSSASSYHAKSMLSTSSTSWRIDDLASSIPSKTLSLEGVATYLNPVPHQPLPNPSMAFKSSVRISEAKLQLPRSSLISIRWSRIVWRHGKQADQETAI